MSEFADFKNIYICENGEVKPLQNVQLRMQGFFTCSLEEV